jgi:hypothetical protein
MHPGAEDALQGPLLVNSSHRIVTIESVSLSGHGIGTVERLIGLWLAPELPPKATPGGNFVTFPPTVGTKGHCSVQALFPVHGYRIQPQEHVRILELYQAERPGVMSNSGVTVDFSVSGASGSQFVTFGADSTVSQSASPMAVPNYQKDCLAGVRRLPAG